MATKLVELADGGFIEVDEAILAQKVEMVKVRAYGKNGGLMFNMPEPEFAPIAKKYGAVPIKKPGRTAAK
jgi:hypothetical protein